MKSGLKSSRSHLLAEVQDQEEGHFRFTADGSILSSYSLREDRTHKLMTDSLHFIFVELEHFDKRWEDIDNDKERFYFCIRRLHELDNLPEGFTEGIWVKLAQQSELAEKLDAARKMKEDGLSAETICRYIGLYAFFLIRLIPSRIGSMTTSTRGSSAILELNASSPSV